jgi:hypothetical protein
VTGGKPITILLQSISGVSAINLLVAFYDIHGGKREVAILLFCRGHYTRLMMNSIFECYDSSNTIGDIITSPFFHNEMAKLGLLSLLKLRNNIWRTLI